ncbi:MAG TPA: hypothetical protein VFZ75_06485 [Actinomycetota bacterium]|nr:hypothetical protein [Actinomycetota bacterium]
MSDRPDDASGPDLPPPPGDPQDESPWNDDTPDVPWPSGRSRMPGPGEWLGIPMVVIVVLVAVRGLFWLLGKFLP